MLRYESEINDISTFFEGGDLYKSTIVDNKTNGSNRHNIYENQRTMANYLTKVQKEKNVDIIVVSHQQEMNEIGSFLENPKVAKIFFDNLENYTQYFYLPCVFKKNLQTYD